jgi:hypothetical protein
MISIMSTGDHHLRGGSCFGPTGFSSGWPGSDGGTVADKYWHVPGMMYPFWVVNKNIAHNLDADTDMGDLSVKEFHLYFPHARTATLEEVEDYERQPKV